MKSDMATQRRKQEVKLKHQQNRGGGRKYKDQRSFQRHQTKNSKFPDDVEGRNILWFRKVGSCGEK